VPTEANPAVVHGLPEAVRQPYIESFAAALEPVFVVASGFAVVAFLLTWLLRDVPLRATAPAEGIGESFASPREDRSDRELERILSAIAAGRARTDIYRRIVDESQVELIPAEAWLLGRLATAGVLEQAPARSARPEEIAPLTARLLERGYLGFDSAADSLELTARGRDAHARLVDAGRAELMRLIADVRPPDDEVVVVLRRLAVSLLADMPRDGTRAPRPRA
jgi:hypothetical protein